MHNFLLDALKGGFVLTVLFYLVAPLLIKLTQTMSASPRLEELDGSALPPAAAEFLYTTANILREDGFVPEAYLSAAAYRNPICRVQYPFQKRQNHRYHERCDTERFQIRTE